MSQRMYILLADEFGWTAYWKRWEPARGRWARRYRNPAGQTCIDSGVTVTSLKIWALAIAIFAIGPIYAWAQSAAPDVCPRPAAGSAVPEPEDLRSENGVLKVELTYRNFVDADGHMRYCYVSKDGSQAPTLRLKPGDELILSLKNEVTELKAAQSQKLSAPVVSTSRSDLPTTRPLCGALPKNQAHLVLARESSRPSTAHEHPKSTDCAGGEMTPEATNIHFHGLNIPPVCHQDDVMNTMIEPGDPPFEYRFKVPENEPPGLYWYHPHVHGFTKVQVLGGASGALIVEGVERAVREVAGLPERVLIVRDQDLLNPNAPPATKEGMVIAPAVVDRDGDALNTGTGTGKPAKDLSLNFVPVAYPDYHPATIVMRPSEQQLWRVLNASAITYLNLQVLLNGGPQMLGVVALDGVPINHNGMSKNGVVWQNHLGVPPGGRVEFIVKGPAEGETGSLVTLSVNTGAGGENDPVRPLAIITASDQAPEPRSRLSASPKPFPPPASAWLGNIKPVRTRKLFFSEKLQDPNDPNSPTTFFLTVDGQTPKVFDPSSTIPNITTHEGDVEDWVIENRTQELHAFHIHQVHFMLVEWFGVAVNEPFLRDTINVPFWDGKSASYPRVRVRMDFRDPNSVGMFVYHCHLLEHEDGGMMGLILVEPRVPKDESNKSAD